MAKINYDSALAELRQSAGNLRCSDIGRILKGLGFDVQDGKSANHKTFDHQHIQHFFGGSYNCGHGKNPEVGRIYVLNIIKTLEELEVELREYLAK